MLTAQNCRCAHSVPREFVHNEDHRCGKQLVVELGDGVISEDRGTQEWLDPGMLALEQAVIRTQWELRARAQGIKPWTRHVRNKHPVPTDEMLEFIKDGAPIPDEDAYADFLEDLGEELNAEAVGVG